MSVYTLSGNTAVLTLVEARCTRVLPRTQNGSYPRSSYATAVRVLQRLTAQNGRSHVGDKTREGHGATICNFFHSNHLIHLPTHWSGRAFSIIVILAASSDGSRSLEGCRIATDTVGPEKTTQENGNW